MGAWGNFGLLKASYSIYASLHQLTECFVKANSKRHSTKKPQTFQKWLGPLADIIGFDNKEESVGDKLNKMFGVNHAKINSQD